jgi:hypothetical protein
VTREERLAHLKDLKVDERAKYKEHQEAKRAREQFELELFEDMQSTNTFAQRQGNTNYVLKTTIFSNVTDREAFVEWCRARELDDEFLRETEEKARLNEFVRAALDNNEDLPDGVDWYAKQYISITEKEN